MPALLQKLINLFKVCRKIGNYWMNDFKWRHFQEAIILGCVRWYCKYRISYCDLEEMMEERGIKVDKMGDFVIKKSKSGVSSQ